MRFSLRLGSWEEIGESARAIREAVFIVEQKVPPEMEWDDFDAISLQALATDEAGNAIGTGRLLPDGRIGRLAILSASRGQGVGEAILKTLIAEAKRRGLPGAILSAQTQAREFYEKNGFVAVGEEYMDAGIPHITMKLGL